MNLKNNRVSEFGQDVRACALGQAAAAILGSHIIGKSAKDLAEIHQHLQRFLTGDSVEAFLPDWSELAVFAPAVPHRARHASILLAFEAAAQAAGQHS